jgi:hypothetical protein
MRKIQPNKKQRTRRRSRTRFGRKIRYNLTRRTRRRQCPFIVPVPIDIMMPNRDRDARLFQPAHNPPQHLQQLDKPPLLNTDPVLRKQRIQVHPQRHLPLAPETPQPPDLFLQRLPPFSAVSERRLRVGTPTRAAAASCCSHSSHRTCTLSQRIFLQNRPPCTSPPHMYLASSNPRSTLHPGTRKTSNTLVRKYTPAASAANTLPTTSGSRSQGVCCC